MQRRFVLAVTGSSGSVYGRRLAGILAGSGALLHLTVSEAGARVFQHETGRPLDPDNGESVMRALLGAGSFPNVLYHHHSDLEQAIASGSYRHDGMVICPCSTGTIGRIASGVSTGLIGRAAEVCLKERRTLILVPRETPYSEITLENMLRLARAGATILPASPGFYGPSDRVEQLVDFVVSRILDHLGVENNLMQRYGEAPESGGAQRRSTDTEGDYPASYA